MLSLRVVWLSSFHESFSYGKVTHKKISRLAHTGNSVRKYERGKYHKEEAMIINSADYCSSIIFLSKHKLETLWIP
jgi:hypothetical protein